jgi:hypothetical protein
VVLAALGERESEVPPLTPDEQRQARRQALGVAVRSLVVGVVTSAIVWWLVHFRRP